MTTLTEHEQFAGARRRLMEAMPTHFDRLRWGTDQLVDLQTTRLRALLTTAIECSPFHAKRLAGIDPTTFDVADLAQLPPMTKTEMMAAYDDAVCDRRITREAVEAHLAEVTDEPRLLLDEYLVVTSGGSSGIRGVFALHIEAATEAMSAVLRGGLARIAAVTGWPPSAPTPMAIVGAPSAIHPTRCLPVLGDGTIANVTHASVTLPFDEIVERVQRAQPVVLAGYATAIARLGDAAAAGRLDIAPQIVLATSEQLTPDIANRITTGLGAPPVNSFGSSEGLTGSAPPGSDIFDFASDLAIIEYVDADDQSVPAGAAAHHVLITNLGNDTQPLIRYRLDDVMIEAPAAADHGHQRARLEGRSDEPITVNGHIIHPAAVRSTLLRQREVAEYQIRGHDNGLTIDVVAIGPIDADAVRAEIDRAISSNAAAAVPVAVNVVDAIERNPRTGKARRLVTAESAQADRN